MPPLRPRPPVMRAVVAQGRPATLPQRGPMRSARDHELAARTDFAKVDQDWREAMDRLTTRWDAITAAQRAELAAQIAEAVDSGDTTALAELSVDHRPAYELLLEHLRSVSAEAAREMAAEAARQGVEAPPAEPDPVELETTAEQRALLLAGLLAATAGKRAMRLVTGSSRGSEVADEVSTYMRGLSGAEVRAHLSGATSAAVSAGRMAVLKAAPPATYYASEMLDRQACKPCRGIDEHRFATLAEAQEAYPAGTYRDCAGQDRCRGMVVAVWDQSGEEAAPIAASAEGNAMPWHKQKGHADCPDGKPWAVVKDSDGSVAGCHASEDSADDQLAALYASDDADSSAGLEDAMTETVTAEVAGGKPNPGTDRDDRLRENRRKAKKKMSDTATEALVGDVDVVAADDSSSTDPATAPWQGVLTVEGVETGDGREFNSGALVWDDSSPGAMPLMWQKVTSHGGGTDQSVRVGTVLKVWREDDGRIMGHGVFDLGGTENDDAHEAHRRMRDGFLTGNSVDVDSVKDADVTYVFPSNGDDGDDEMAALFRQPEKAIFNKGRIRGTTLVEFPAFTEARLALIEDGTAEAEQIAAAAAEMVAARKADPEETMVDDALVAHGAPEDDWRPPREWFDDPGFNVLTPIVVTEDGRVYGHAAEFGDCHLGYGDECVRVPAEDAFPYFMTGSALCEDGSTVSVGQITAGIGHAPLHLAARPASEHYDDTAAVVADVAVGNDKHGIWVAGAVRPDAQAGRVRALRASGQVSPDWRAIGGKLRMVGLLTVNVSGFQVPAPQARVASGEMQALVAAGIPNLGRGLTQADVEQAALRMARDRILSRMGAAVPAPEE